MLDIKNYQELKEKNAVSLVKAGDAYAVAYKKFDEATGEEKSDEVIGVNMTELTDKKKALQDEIAEIDAFIADCKVLNVEEIEKVI